MRQGATLQDGVAPGWSRTRLLVSRELELRLESANRTDHTHHIAKLNQYANTRDYVPDGPVSLSCVERERRSTASCSRIKVLAGSDYGRFGLALLAVIGLLLKCWSARLSTHSATSFNFNILVELSSARRLPANSLLI